jgi:hypothetical protein
MGLAITLAAAAYVVMPKGQTTVPGGQDSITAIPGSPYSIAQNDGVPEEVEKSQVYAPLERGGCGCGGGGLSCGAGTAETAPDTSKVTLTGDDAGAQGADVQDVSIRALADGTYDKREIDVKAGIPVKLRFSADPDAGCGRSMVIFGLGLSTVSRSGEESDLEFIPTAPGRYEISCGMRMWGPAWLVVS